MRGCDSPACVDSYRSYLVTTPRDGKFNPKRLTVGVVIDTILIESTTVGEMLSEEFLKPLNIIQVKLGEALNLSRARIAEIIRGKRGS